MPASSEHGARIKKGLAFLSAPASAAFHEQQVIEYFYSCLHMFEAAVYDFTPKPKQQHFYSHNDRTKFLSASRLETKSPFFNVARDYEALRELSEQARYLSPAGSQTHEPLRIPQDINDAKQLHNDIKSALEEEYKKRKKPHPWQ